MTQEDKPTPPPIEHPVSDPITGTRPVGPIVTDDRRHAGSKGWAFAARWLVFALLSILLITLLIWLM